MWGNNGEIMGKYGEIWGNNNSRHIVYIKLSFIVCFIKFLVILLNYNKNA